MEGRGAMAIMITAVTTWSSRHITGEPVRGGLPEAAGCEAGLCVALRPTTLVRLGYSGFRARRNRLWLTLGVAEWIFAHSDGLVGYSATDYDTISQLRW